jgi:hypothetical protein
MVCAVIAYLLGAVADYLQCHFQAGGIGTHCNGTSCLRVAGATLVCFAVGRWRPRFLFLFCFGVQGALRLEWAERGDLPDVLRAIVVAFAITLITLPAVAYFRELAAALILKVSGGEEQGKEADLEMDASETEYHSAPWLLKLWMWMADTAAETLSADGTLKQDCSKPAAASPPLDADHARPCICVEAALPEQPRVKENDGRAGCGSSSESTEYTPMPGQSPELVPEVPVMKRVAFCDSVIKKELDCSTTKLKYTDRKRKRREELNSLVSTLDHLLPAEARRGGFKGAGPRSAGVLGRSFINVLTDTVEHLKILEAHALSRKPTKLGDLRLTYRDGPPLPPPHLWLLPTKRVARVERPCRSPSPALHDEYILTHSGLCMRGCSAHLFQNDDLCRRRGRR